MDFVGLNGLESSYGITFEGLLEDPAFSSPAFIVAHQTRVESPSRPKILCKILGEHEPDRVLTFQL